MTKKIRMYPLNPDTPRAKAVKKEKLEPISLDLYDDYGYVCSIENKKSVDTNIDKNDAKE